MFEFIWICEWRNTDIRLVSFFVWALDSGAEVSSKNRQDRAGVMAVIQKKSSQATTTATVLQAKYTNSV